MNKPFFIVDAHMHMGTDWRLFNPEDPFGGFLKTMERHGIERAYSSHYLWLQNRFDAAVADSIRCYEKSGKRIPFLGVYNPLQEKDSIRSFDNCLEEEGFIGIKIHPSFHGVPADSPLYKTAWDYASEHSLPILSHTWSVTYNPAQKLSLPSLFSSYIEEYPDVVFIMGHCGGRGNGQLEALKLAEKHRNVYLDIAADIFCLDLIPAIVKSLGPEKLLFGSDWPWFDASLYMARILLAPLEERDKALILGLNALKIFEPGYFKKLEPQLDQRFL